MQTNYPLGEIISGIEWDWGMFGENITVERLRYPK